MTHEYPDYFARFYDLIYHKLRDGVDNKYFLDQIKQTKGKILEVGVGTGRFFIDALSQEADIYGFDISSSMLDVLKSKLNKTQQERVSLQNIIDFQYDFKFDLIIAPFRVIMHLLDKSSQIEAINNVYKHLNQNGIFIFDTFVPDLNYLIKGLDSHTDFDEEYKAGKRVKRIVSTKPDLINQLISIDFQFEWDEDNGRQTKLFNIPLRFFFRYELEHLIERTKFKSYQIFGDYNENKLRPDSKEFIVKCRK
ncbi:MAG: class I SAM-dependent methyltransferase [Saprospiraceae bacterium]|nr:class I SAM-dependent methyltransferase [Saprospiraceae bacterium]